MFMVRFAGLLRIQSWWDGAVSPVPRSTAISVASAQLRTAKKYASECPAYSTL